MPGIREALGQKQIHWELRRLRSMPSGSGSGGVSQHAFLGGAHSKTAIADPIQGAMVLADDTPEWNIFAHPTAAGYALVTDATDVAWDQTPTWTGRHSWDDGAGVTAYVDEDGSAWFEGHVGILGTPDPSYALGIVDVALDYGAGIDYRGQYIHLEKTAGASTNADNFYGSYVHASLDQAAGTVGDQYGVYSHAQLIDGNVGDAGSNKSMYGVFSLVNLDAGKVWENAAGFYAQIDQEAANDIGGDAYGAYLKVDITGSIGGDSYMLYLEEVGGVYYGIYQDGTADNVLGGDTSIGGPDNPLAQLHVDQSNAAGAQPALLLDQGDVSEQHIVLSIDSTDVDFPAIIELDVTGTPTMWWDESEDAFSQTHDQILEPRCFGFLKAQDENGRVGNGPIEYGEVAGVCGILEIAPGAALFETVTIN